MQIGKSSPFGPQLWKCVLYDLIYINEEMKADDTFMKDKDYIWHIFINEWLKRSTLFFSD